MMTILANLADFMAFFSAFLLLLLTTNMAFEFGIVVVDNEDMDNENNVVAFVVPYNPLFDPEHVTATTLYNFCLTNVLSFFDADLGFVDETQINHMVLAVLIG